MKATILYTLARIAVFVVPFAILLGSGLSWFLSGVIAAVIGFLLSFILLGRLRTGMAESIDRRRTAPERDEDADLEDAVLDESGIEGMSPGGVLNGRPVTPSRPAPRRSGPPAEGD